MPTGTENRPEAGAPDRRPDNLAYQFQEVLTAIVRLRANTQPVSDAEIFRTQFRTALKTAEDESARRDYIAEDVRLVTFAVVAFLDESILNSRNPVFAAWPRKPLQEELFGVHIAGEIFFRNLERLLAKPDSQHLGDVLEVHQLCLLLGFRGKYSAIGVAELHTISQAIEEKIKRIRGFDPQFSSTWKPPSEPPRRAADPWVRRLAWIAAATCFLALLMFAVYKLSLMSGVSDVEATAAQIRL